MRSILRIPQEEWDRVVSPHPSGKAIWRTAEQEGVLALLNKPFSFVFVSESFATTV